jgi:hypothetical protein
VHGHRAHRILGHRTHVRDDHDAHHQAGTQHVEARQIRHEPLQRRGHHQQREIAVHDGRNAGQQLQGGLHDFARAVPGEFGQVDCRHRAHGDRQRQRHAGGGECAGQQRQHAEMLVGEHDGPLRVGQKVLQRHVLEEGG